jgi:hypothetical protein
VGNFFDLGRAERYKKVTSTPPPPTSSGGGVPLQSLIVTRRASTRCEHPGGSTMWVAALDDSSITLKAIEESCY